MFYCGAYQLSKFSPILSAKAVFISLLISSKHLFSVVAEFHLNFWEVFHKPNTSLFVLLLVFQRLRHNLLARVLGILFSILLFQWSIFYYFFRRHCDVALFTHQRELSGSCSFLDLSIQPECCVPFAQVLSFYQVLHLCSTRVLPEFFLSHLVLTRVVSNSILSIKLLVRVFAIFKFS